MSGKYFLGGSILEKCRKIWKNSCFAGRLQPDWGNTAWPATAGLGSKGLNTRAPFQSRYFRFYCYRGRTTVNSKPGSAYLTGFGLLFRLGAAHCG